MRLWETFLEYHWPGNERIKKYDELRDEHIARTGDRPETCRRI